MITVVPLSKYCDINNEKINTVIRRIERGVWQTGKQVLVIEGVKERWIDLTEVEKWARNGGSCREA